MLTSSGGLATWPGALWLQGQEELSRLLRRVVPTGRGWGCLSLLPGEPDALFPSSLPKTTSLE